MVRLLMNWKSPGRSIIFSQDVGMVRNRREHGNRGISEIAVNAALAFVEGAKPQDEVECALVVQMACTHAAAMALLRKIGAGQGSDRNIGSSASAVAKLLRAYTRQVETLRRLRQTSALTMKTSLDQNDVHCNVDFKMVLAAILHDYTFSPK